MMQMAKPKDRVVVLGLMATCALGGACGGDEAAVPQQPICEPTCQGNRAVLCREDGVQEWGDDCAALGATCDRGQCVVRPPGLMPGDGASGSPMPSFPDAYGRERSAIQASPRQLPRQSSPSIPQRSAVAHGPDGYIRITPAGTDEQDDFDRRPNPCPSEMVQVMDVCMDRYEAPNRPGAKPLVMFTMIQAEAWCQARSKRLCFDDEWTEACQGPNRTAYPYGNTYEPGRCNDNQIWRQYNGPVLQQWPHSAASPRIYSYAQQLRIAHNAGRGGSEAAEHIDGLYQATSAGRKQGCDGYYGVYDLVGNVEEWTRRRDGGSPGGFRGRLKGRFWAESRTCQSQVSNHGDGFRFYEIGFRCCMDPIGD